MVLPGGPLDPVTPRVRYIRNARGTIQFQDLDTGRFISREDALGGLRFDFETARLRDSRGVFVPYAALQLPGAGRSVAYTRLTASYRPLNVALRNFTPNQNQEVIERLVLIRRDGSLQVVETSYGLGRRYDRSQRGGWWRAKTSEALGLDPEERLSTRELQSAVADRQFIVKTTRATR